MSPPTVDELVSDYLARLEEAARELPAGRRTELLDEIGEHIDAAREAGAGSDEAAVRTMLDRLGEPEDIVAAALAEDAGAQPSAGSAAAPAGAARRPGTGLALAAVLLLTVGSLIPVVGWAVGVALLWASRLWRPSEKLLGTLVVPGGPGLFFWFGTLFAVRTCAATATGSASGTVEESTTCTVAGLPPWLGTSLFAAGLVAPFVVGAVLYMRARARAAAAPAAMQEPAQPAPTPARAEPTGPSPWGGSEIAAVALLGASTVVAIALLGPAGLLLGMVALVAGLVLAWSSQQWTRREKWIATVIAAVPPAVALLGAVALIMMWRVM